MNKALTFLAALAATGLLLPAAGLAKTGGWAVLDDGGTLVKGSNVKSTKSLGTGEYQVKFNDSIKKCAVVATAGSHKSGTKGPSSVTFWSRLSSKNNKTIEVFVYDNDSQQLISTGFSVMVSC